MIQAGRTMGLRFNEKGKYLRSFVAPESCFIDIMMNVGIIFYAANRTGRPRSAAKGGRALPDDAALSRAWRRQHRARGHLRPADRRVLAPDDAPGLARRFLVGAGADLGALWLWHRVLLLGRRALPGHGGALRRFLHRAHATARRPAERLGRTVAAATLRKLGRGDRRQRSLAAGRADARPGAGGERYNDYARTILDTLLTREFLAVDTPGLGRILKHGSYHERKDLGVDESVMWGEYFFVEALDKLLGAPAVS